MRSWNKILILFLLVGCAHSRGGAWRWAYDEELGEAKRMMETGNHRQAIDELSMLLEMNPQNEEVRFARGIAYQNLGEFKLATQDYEAILKENPNSSKTHFNLGMIYAYHSSDGPKALLHFDKFLDLEPQHAKVFHVAKIMASIDTSGSSSPPELQEKIDSILELGSPDKKKELLKTVAEQYPASPLPFHWIGKICDYEGKGQEALFSYQQALERSPTFAPTHQAIFQLLKKQGEMKRAKPHQLKAELFSKVFQEGLVSSGVGTESTPTDSEEVEGGD